MTEKSHVSMEQHQCVACFTLFETGAILLDKRLEKSMERHTVTGQGMCPACEARKAEGYIALVEVAGERERRPTGVVSHIRATIWSDIFNSPLPAGGVAHVSPEVTAHLRKVSGQDN